MIKASNTALINLENTFSCLHLTLLSVVVRAATTQQKYAQGHVQRTLISPSGNIHIFPFKWAVVSLGMCDCGVVVF